MFETTSAKVSAQCLQSLFTSTIAVRQVVPHPRHISVNSTVPAKTRFHVHHPLTQRSVKPHLLSWSYGLPTGARVIKKTNEMTTRQLPFVLHFIRCDGLLYLSLTNLVFQLDGKRGKKTCRGQTLSSTLSGSRLNERSSAQIHERLDRSAKTAALHAGCLRPMRAPIFRSCYLWRRAILVLACA